MAKIAMPLTNDYEDSELRVPYERLTAAGHEVTVIGLEPGQSVRGKRGNDEMMVDERAADVSARDFDALVIPGGYSPDQLRTDGDVVRFVKEFTQLDRPVAAVCHGPQLLIEADAVRGRVMTSWPSVRKDLENAGARWVDKEVCQDGKWITSRNPDDLPAFSEAILKSLN